MRRSLIAAGILGLAAALMGPVLPAGASTPLAVSAHFSHASSGGCGPDSSCETIGTHCSAGSKCPSVVAEPVNNLQPDQWVYLSLENFPPQSEAEVYLCSDKTRLTTKTAPFCVVLGSAAFQYPSQQLPIFPNGADTTSFQVEGRPHTHGEIPFSGEIPGESEGPKRNFYCDDKANPCSIDVYDWSLLPANPPPANKAVMQPADTAIIPLDFAPATNGCAHGLSVVTTSDFSVEELFPGEAPFACKDKVASTPFDTATDSDIAVQSLVSGASTVGFIDDPQDPTLQQLLNSSGQHYAMIPVAASSVVVGYEAAMQSQGLLMYPFHGFELTPNMVAGLVTYNYQFPYGSDVVKCPLPSMPAPCSALEDLNTVPTFTPAGTYGAFIPSIVSGVTENLTDWLCHAPNKPFMLDGKLVRDPNTAAATFTHSSYEKPWPIKSCTTFDQFPPLKTPSAGVFNLVTDPSHQVKYLRLFSPPASYQSAPDAGFAPMDWGDARLNGLDVAALQNAAGQFVQPTAESVDAEISAWTISPAGYPIPDYTKAVKGGYPLSTVIDAIVPTGKQSSTQQTAIASMMNDLLAYTTNPKTVLPDGYAPLPASMAKSAKAELAAALLAEQGTSTATTTSTTTTTTTSGATTSPSTPPVTTAPGGSHGGHHSGGRTGNHRGAKAPSSGQSSLDGSQVALVASASRLALPGALLAGVLLIVLSLILSGYGRTRRRDKGAAADG
ncbi:MAG: hypothetical protein ACLQK4_03785 [Acidimicrobiales bacterium]|jgi:hypothetical protein